MLSALLPLFSLDESGQNHSDVVQLEPSVKGGVDQGITVLERGKVLNVTQAIMKKGTDPSRTFLSEFKDHRSCICLVNLIKNKEVQSAKTKKQK